MQLPPITSLQQQILFLIYRFRFLYRLHLQTLLSHKSPSPTKTLLADLTTKKYLTRIYTPTFPQNTKPAIYFIDTHALHYLKTLPEIDQTHLQKLYHEKNRSEGFRTHCLALADLYCNLLSYSRKQNKGLIFFTRADLHQQTDTYHILFLQEIHPDGYYRYKGTGIAKQAFIEIIDEQTPAFVIRRIVRKYARAFQDGTWDVLNTSRFPSLLCIAPTEKKLNSIKHAIHKVRTEFDDEELNEKLHCNITLISDIQTKSIADPIWETA